jgi:enoyl-CoA hydratase
MRWLLTGDEFDAAEAHRIGFVQEVTAPGEQLSRALAIAETIAAQAPLGVYATLASSRLEITAGEEEAARRLLPDLAPILGSEDVKEGIASFVERRQARFTGK